MAKLLTALPDDQGTWTFAQGLGSNVEADYWLTKGPYWLKGSKNELLTAIGHRRRRGCAMSDKIVQHPRRDMKLERDITRSPEAQALQDASR